MLRDFAREHLRLHSPEPAGWFWHHHRVLWPVAVGDLITPGAAVSSQTSNSTAPSKCLAHRT